MILWIRNSLNTDGNRNGRSFNDSYTLYSQDYGATMFFVVLNMVLSDTLAGRSDIKTKPDNIKMSELKKYTYKADL